jgi:hypothetical protein
VVILGPDRKVLYLAYSLSGDASNPIHLEPIGNPPVLTTGDEPILVIVNKQPSDQPASFDLAFTVKAGSFIDVAPVRPTTAQAAAKVAPESPEYVDSVLRFHKAFLGEQIVDYDISGYFKAETSNKVTKTTDVPPAKDSPGSTEETETVNETGAHKIYSGELPQVHSVYHYNIATGVVATFLRDPSFARVLTSLKSGDANPAKYATEQQPGSDRAMPVLMFSAYLKPLDAQVPWHSADLLPAPTIGFSLSSPASDFFFGVSHEIRRHVQLVYGYHLGKVTAMSKTQGLDDPTSDAAPVTTTRFKGNFFVGATFNIDFIKGLFK